jgi:hypothetical protein
MHPSGRPLLLRTFEEAEPADIPCQVGFMAFHDQYQHILKQVIPDHSEYQLLMLMRLWRRASIEMRHDYEIKYPTMSLQWMVGLIDNGYDDRLGRYDSKFGRQMMSIRDVVRQSGNSIPFVYHLATHSPHLFSSHHRDIEMHLNEFNVSQECQYQAFATQQRVNDLLHRMNKVLQVPKYRHKIKTTTDTFKVNAYSLFFGTHRHAGMDTLAVSTLWRNLTPAENSEWIDKAAVVNGIGVKYTVRRVRQVSDRNRFIGECFQQWSDERLTQAEKYRRAHALYSATKSS